MPATDEKEKALIKQLQSVKHTFVAMVLGVAPKTVYKWAESTSIPVKKGNKFNLFQVVKWYIDRVKQSSKAQEKTDEEIKRLKKQNQILDAKHKTLTNEMISKIFVLEIHKEMAYEMKGFWIGGIKQNSRKMCKDLKIPISKAPLVEKVFLSVLKSGFQAFETSGKKLSEL